MFQRSSTILGLAATCTLAATLPARAQMYRVPLPAPATAPPLPANAPPTLRGVHVPIFVPSVANQAINPNFRIAPNLTLPQATYNLSVFGQAASQIPPYVFGFNPYPQRLSAGPIYSLPGSFAYGSQLNAGLYGSGSGSYGSPYEGSYGSYEDPYAGYLRGSADLISSQGRYLGQGQQARLLQSQADASTLDLRRRIADEAAMERRYRLDPETERLKEMQAAYSRATRDPPISEILSGQALNDLYNHAYPLREKGRTLGSKAPPVALDPDLVRQLNLTGTGSAGNFAVFKDRGRLSWPLALQAPEYAADRKSLAELAVTAAERLRNNQPVDSAVIRDMGTNLRRLSDALLTKVGELSPTDYIGAKRFLAELDGAIRSLRDPSTSVLSNQAREARLQTVAELVDWMGQKGLKFAPATSGDEPAYRHVYERLRAFDATLTETVAKP